MKYFEIVQDSRIYYGYSIENLTWEENAGETIGVGYFKGGGGSLPDFIIYKKQFLVSAKLKNVIEMYTDKMNYKLIIFNNIEAKVQKEYYSIEPIIVEGLGEGTTYFKNGFVDTEVLSQSKLKDYKIFRIKELEPTEFSKPHIFVDLDIVESILRRNLWGMTFEKTLVEE
ncbi:hypothetical protein UT300005_16890 [Clostridium sp. CTA-5]